MAVRRLSLDDAPAFRSLRLRALREHPEAFTSSFHEEQARPLGDSAARLDATRTAFWGAFRSRGVLCAIVGLERLSRTQEQHKGRIVAMYVAPEAAGQGYGTELLQVLLGHARNEGLEDLVLTVTEGNDIAVRLYRRAGFKEFGVEPRAVRVEGRSLAKVHMHLALR